jgi:hypothetical protein
VVYLHRGRVATVCASRRCDATWGGEDAASIAAELGRTERWVSKWTARDCRGEAEWFAPRDRRPHRSPRATPEEMVALVLAACDRLEADPRAQRGQAAVAWELLAMGGP